jgi:hypothetical protein
MRIRTRRRGRDCPCDDPLHQLATLIGREAYEALEAQGAPVGVCMFLGAAQLPAHLKPAAAAILHRGGMINDWGLAHPAEVLGNLAEDECEINGWPVPGGRGA